MRYEVEQKFYVDDPAGTERALARLGARVGPPTVQADVYLTHPARDFGATDEALRMRRVGEENFITYKGPRVDATTKTRLEMELPLPPGEDYAARFAEMLELLGFGSLVEIHKERRTAEVSWEGSTITVSLDRVVALGSFVELETVVPEQEVDAARRHVAALAAELGLSRNERTSYCELMLARSGARRDAAAVA